MEDIPLPGRVLVGDLSGLQRRLSRLKAQGVTGLALDGQGGAWHGAAAPGAAACGALRAGRCRARPHPGDRGHPHDLGDLAQAPEAAERFNARLRDGTPAASALWRLLALDDARRRVAAERGRGADHGRRAKLAYHLARLRPAHGDGKVPVAVFEAFRNLFGIGADWKAPPAPPPDLRLTLSHALYRNR